MLALLDRGNPNHTGSRAGLELELSLQQRRAFLEHESGSFCVGIQFEFGRGLVAGFAGTDNCGHYELHHEHNYRSIAILPSAQHGVLNKE